MRSLASIAWASSVRMPRSCRTGPSAGLGLSSALLATNAGLVDFNGYVGSSEAGQGGCTSVLSPGGVVSRAAIGYASLPLFHRQSATDMPRITASPALSRLRILDLTRVRAGPTCVKQFADFGADVVKIENTEVEDMGGARDGPDFQNLHRNKRSMTLNLKAPEGKATYAIHSGFAALSQDATVAAFADYGGTVYLVDKSGKVLLSEKVIDLASAWRHWGANEGSRSASGRAAYACRTRFGEGRPPPGRPAGGPAGPDDENGDRGWETDGARVRGRDEGRPAGADRPAEGVPTAGAGNEN